MNEIRQLIDMMQSNLVELFAQLRDLREKLQITTEFPEESSPSIIPLFSEIKPKDEPAGSTQSEIVKDEPSIKSNDTNAPVNLHPGSGSPKNEDVSSKEESVTESLDTSTAGARVNRVLDPIAHELRTGEATADIILEYLQAAKDYLIDEDGRKKKVGRDMDIVLNFLKARGKRSIRTEERDNILKRIRRWKAHLVSYSDSPER